MQTAKVNALFDKVIHNYRLKSDAALSRLLKVGTPAVISKMRHGRMPVGPTMILSLHENGGLLVADIRAALAEDSSAGYEVREAMTGKEYKFPLEYRPLSKEIVKKRN